MLSLSRVPFALLVLLAGCSSELTRDQAAKELYEHFLVAGPHLADSLHFTAEDILVEEILQPSETRRDVRFRIQWHSDTTVIHDVLFTRSDEGWAVSSYGSSATHFVASLVSAYRQNLYADLLPYIRYLSDVQSQWVLAYDPGARSHDTRSIVYRVKHAPSRSELESLISSDSLPPARVRWGVFPDNEPELIWVRDIGDSGRVCADPQGWDSNDFITGEYSWVDEKESYQCTGDVASYDLFMATDVVAAITENGGIWLD